MSEKPIIEGPAVDCTMTRHGGGLVVIEGATTSDAMAGAAAYFRARNERRAALEKAATAIAGPNAHRPEHGGVGDPAYLRRLAARGERDES